jgi:hypothetical protein
MAAEVVRDKELASRRLMASGHEGGEGGRRWRKRRKKVLLVARAVKKARGSRAA